MFNHFDFETMAKELNQNRKTEIEKRHRALPAAATIAKAQPTIVSSCRLPPRTEGRTHARHA